jgi:hypothetical protein
VTPSISKATITDDNVNGRPGGRLPSSSGLSSGSWWEEIPAFAGMAVRGMWPELGM